MRSFLLGSLKVCGGYLLFVVALLAVSPALESLASFETIRRFIGVLFQVFGSWFIVMGAHFVGRWLGNRAMRDRVKSGFSGEMKNSTRIWLAAETTLGILGAAALPALAYLDSIFQILVGAVVVSLPAFVGTNEEIKRWLAGIKKLSAVKADLHWTAVVEELDTFGDVGVSAPDEF